MSNAGLRSCLRPYLYLRRFGYDRTLLIGGCPERDVSDRQSVPPIFRWLAPVLDCFPIIVGSKTAQRRGIFLYGTRIPAFSSVSLGDHSFVHLNQPLLIFLTFFQRPSLLFLASSSLLVPALPPEVVRLSGVLYSVSSSAFLFACAISSIPYPR